MNQPSKSPKYRFDFWFWVLLIIVILVGVKYNNEHNVIPALRFGSSRQVANSNRSKLPSQSSHLGNSNGSSSATSSSNSSSQSTAVSNGPNQLPNHTSSRSTASSSASTSSRITTAQHRYSTPATAANRTGYQNKSKVAGLSKVDLGNHQTGHIDHGAGQTYIAFYVGKWSVVVHGSLADSRGMSPQAMAKRLVIYFHTHNLPVNDSGSLNVNSNDNSASVSYQKDPNTVVTDKGTSVDKVLQKL